MYINEFNIPPTITAVPLSGTSGLDTKLYDS